MRYFVLVASLLFVTSCSVQNLKEKKDLVVLQDYGIWKVADCSIASSRSEISVGITDIYKTDKTARLVVESNVQLQEVPKFKVYGLNDYNFNLTGTRGAYVLDLPIDIAQQARMYLDQMFMEVTYKPVGLDYYRKAIFPLKGIPEALTQMEKVCI